LAATGSLLMMAGPGTNRSASLLPFRHIALVPFSRLYRNFEEWLAERREAGTLIDTVRSRANLTLISGPSKSADIEMNLTLGVHGPKFLHAILFDDTPADDDERIRPSDFFDEEFDDDFDEEAQSDRRPSAFDDGFDEDSFDNDQSDFGLGQDKDTKLY
jgi:hypothetical protein